LVGLRWGIFRGTAQPPGVDPFAAAIVAQDLPRRKELIGGHDVEKIEVDAERFPLDVPRRPLVRAGLLDIAAAVGRQVLRYLLEFHRLKPDLITLGQAVAFGDPETIRMIWDRMDALARVGSKSPLVLSIEFHHVEVAKWLVAEHPPWLGLARRIAREKRAFDVLSRLPEGVEELPELDGLVKKHVKALEQLGVPLATLFPHCFSDDKVLGLDFWLDRIGRSLLLVEGDGGVTFGALITIRWPKLGSTAKDVWCRSFLFTIDGEEATRFSATTPPVLFHNEEKICIGELTLDLVRHWYSVGAKSSCTGERFPSLSGKLQKGKWEIWRS
jgi:hypothetical protein